MHIHLGEQTQSELEELQFSLVMPTPIVSIIMETATNYVLVRFISKIFDYTLVLKSHPFQKVLAERICRDVIHSTQIHICVIHYVLDFISSHSVQGMDADRTLSIHV